MDGLHEKEWRRLVETIRRGNCVLVLGPDVAVEPSGSNLTPLAASLARRLLEPLSLSKPAGESNDLAFAAQMVVNRPNYDRFDLELEVSSFYEPYSEQTTDFHRDLAALPFTLCLTTTPDRFLANALREPACGKSPMVAYYNFVDPGRCPELAEPTRDRPIVYELFGDLDDLRSLVISETDLLDFLVNVVRASSGLPSYVASQLAAMQTSFLFIGFGFQHWYTRILLHVLKVLGHRSRSVALEETRFFADTELASTAIFFEQNCSIVFCQHPWSQFAAELRSRYEAVEAQLLTHGSSVPPPGAPKLFLCHDSQDRDPVSELENRLHELGVDTWRDQQDLRGGEEWDWQIRHVIQKQVDYVLVLQTPNMQSRPESYLHREIAEGLERQKGFDTGQLFMIPAMLQSCTGLARLEHLHRRDLASGAGVQRLVEEILADWQQRVERLRQAVH